MSDDTFQDTESQWDDEAEPSADFYGSNFEDDEIDGGDFDDEFDEDYEFLSDEEFEVFGEFGDDEENSDDCIEMLIPDTEFDEDDDVADFVPFEETDTESEPA